MDTTDRPAGEPGRPGSPVEPRVQELLVGGLGSGLVHLLQRRGLTVGTAESCTGGLLSCALAATPDSSGVFVGGVTAYQRRVKFDLLGVSPGPVVTAAAARSMATGVRGLLGTSVGLATTGVAGPAPAEGQSVGTVFLGIDVLGDCTSHRVRLDGDPEAVRHGAVRWALALLYERLAGTSQPRVERRRRPLRTPAL